MPNQLLELGATGLLELGQTSWMGETPATRRIPETIRAIYNFVNVFEDPLAATGIRDSELTPEALQIVNRIRTVNRRITDSLGSCVSLGDVSDHESLMGLAYQLQGHFDRLGINFFSRVGRNIKRIHQHVAHKIIGVVKSPAFLGIAALVVNVIPGVGQAASFALAAAATARKIYAQKIDAAKAKKAQGKLTAQEEAEFLPQVIEYNKKTQEYYQAAGQPIPSKNFINKHGDPTDDTRSMPGVTFPVNIAGKIWVGPGKLQKAPPTPKPGATPVPAAVVVPPPTDQQMAQAVALPAAMALSNGQNAGQVSSFMDSFPQEIQQQAAGEVDEIKKFVNDPSFKATSLKAIGQYVAMAEFDKGAQLGIMTPEQLALADKVKENASDDVLKAIEAGRQSLLTSAAMDGPDAVDAVKKAMAAGSSKGPSLATIGLIGLGLAAAGGGVYLLTRG